MKSAALGIIIVLVLANAALYPYWTTPKDDGFTSGGGDGGEDIVRIDPITVQVPGVRAGDIYQYDYTFFGEIYYMNRTSGNWSRTTLTANGQMLEQVSSPVTIKDGFSYTHDTWQLHTEISMSLRIRIEEYSPGEDNEPLIITGRIQADRDRYATLAGDVPVVNYAGGLLSVEDIKGLDLPVDSFEFNIDNWAYPDPNVAAERTLEESIYGQQSVLTEGQNGTYGENNPDWGNYTQWYNWSLDRSERVRGYDSLRLNITLDFFGFIALHKLVYLSSEVPRPVGIVYNSSTFFVDQNSTSHIILETNQLLQKDGYTRGSSTVPIDHDGKPSTYQRHPLATMRPWEVAPADGGISSSSFDFGLEEALDVALEESDGYRTWLRTHPSPMATGALYYENDIDARNTEYIWNITLEDEPGEWQDRELWGPTNGYSLNITRHVERHPVTGDVVTDFVESEYGPHWGAAAVAEEDLATELVTLASSEDIWASVARIADKAYTGLDRSVDFTEARYFLAMGGIDPTGFGIDLLDTLAGISVPTSNYTWSLQIGNVWEGASTYIVGVDVETGRLLFTTEVDGPQSLQFLLGNL